MVVTLQGGQMEKQEFPGLIFMNHLGFQLRDFVEKVMTTDDSQESEDPKYFILTV